MEWGRIRPTLDLRQALLACIGPSLQGEGGPQVQAACCGPMDQSFLLPSQDAGQLSLLVPEVLRGFVLGGWQQHVAEQDQAAAAPVGEHLLLLCFN